MLYLHHSNRLERLAEALAQICAAPLTDPFAAETVLVPNPGMARWLAVALAERTGVAANYEFPLPAAFVWRVFAAQWPDLPKTAALDRDPLTLRVLAHLPALAAAPAGSELAAYLDDGDALKAYQLCRRIADAFDRYQIYRPDWLLAWEAGDEDHWQAQLWRRLIAEAPPPHRARLLHDFAARAAAGQLQVAGLPERLCVFGLSALPPAYLEVLRSLASLIDVHLLLLNPSAAWWGDIVSERTRARMRREWGRRARPDLSEYYAVGHPLLSALGRQGRDFLDLVTALEPHEHEPFEMPQQDHRLARLQREILLLAEPGSEPRGAAPETGQAAEPDTSITVNRCHGELREVQVLHDRLLALFEADATLEPRQVAVMAPDIDRYAPHLAAVFGAAPAQRAIPWSLADRAPRGHQPLVDRFFELLELPDRRLRASEVLGLLELPALRRGCELPQEAVAELRSAIVDSGVRFGFDGPARAEAGLPESERFTWRFGLDRLLLGYASQEPFAGCAPMSGVQGDLALWVGGLAELVERLEALRRTLREAATPAEWAARLRALLALFDPEEDAEQRSLELLQSAIASFEQHAQAAAFDQPLERRALVEHLRLLLAQPAGAGGFLRGGVTCCALTPMRSVPFRVIAVLGLDDQSFPRRRRPAGFDLMARHTRPGDPVPREEDRYLFLEALLSARDHLHLSYIGRSSKDNAEKPASVVVQELLGVLERMDGPEVCAEVVVEHPLQPFSSRYGGASGLRTYAGEWFERGTPPLPFCAVPLPASEPSDEPLTLDALIDAVTRPARWFLRRRLGIDLFDRSIEVSDDEPFMLDGLGRYQLRALLLEGRLAGIDATVLNTQALGTGLLPDGAAGMLALGEQGAEAGHLATRIEVARGEPLAPVDFTLTLGDRELQGTLDHLGNGGRVVGRAGALKGSDCLRLWIAHLALCAAAPVGVAPRSQLLMWGGEVLSLKPVAEPLRHLHDLAALAESARSEPQPFLAESSWCYASTLARRGDADQALKSARQSYHRGQSPRGVFEEEDPWIALAFRGREPLREPDFAALAMAVYGPLLEHREEDA